MDTDQSSSTLGWCSSREGQQTRLRSNSSPNEAELSEFQQEQRQSEVRLFSGASRSANDETWQDLFEHNLEVKAANIEESSPK